MAQAAAVIASLLVALMAAAPGLVLMPVGLTAAVLVGVPLVAQRTREARALIGATNRYFLVFLALATLSVLWSAAPLTTLYRLYRLYALCLAAFAVALVGWRRERFSRIVLPALLCMTVASIVYVVVNPGDAIETAEHDGIIQQELLNAWRGITLHKNTLGSISAIAVLMSLYALITRATSAWLALIGIAAGVACLLGSRSSTSLFACLFAIALMLLVLKGPFAKRRRLVKLFTFVLATLFLVYSLGVLNIVPGLSAFIEPIIAMTGKDMTFSGRTTIWAIMNTQIVLHPILGIGYAAFWLGPDPPSPAYMFKELMYIYPGEAHNGYLDVMNELGAVGILALIGYLFEFLRQAARLLPFDRAKASLYIALLFMEFIANLSEAHWWNLASVNFVIMTLATFDMARSTLEMRRQAAAPGHAAGTATPRTTRGPQPRVRPLRMPGRGASRGAP